MKIAIIIPNYNGLKFLGKCLDSLSKQSFREFDTIVIDNNSQDGSIEYLKESHGGITIKRLDENYGFSRAVNEGIKMSKGEYVVLLNNDTEVDAYWLENLVKTIKEDEKIFSVSSKMIQYNNRSLIDDAGDQYNLLGWAYKRGDGQSIEDYSQKEAVFSACAGAAIYRKKAFDEIGYFDEDFFAYMEDVDISYRARIHGYKNVYCPDAVVYHVGSGTTGSKYNDFKVKFAARNNIYVAYKNMPLVQLIINMPFLTLGFIVKWLFFLKKGFGKTYVMGMWEGILNLKNINKNAHKYKNIKNYICIEVLLIKNLFEYIFLKMRN